MQTANMNLKKSKRGGNDNKKILNYVLIFNIFMSFMISAFAGSNFFLYILLASSFVPLFAIFYYALSVNIFHNGDEENHFSKKKINFTLNKLIQSMIIFLIVFLLVTRLPFINSNIVFTPLGSPFELGLLLMLTLLNILSSIPTIVIMFSCWIIVKNFDYKTQRVNVDDKKALKGLIIFGSFYFLKFIFETIYANDVLEKDLQGIEFLKGNAYILLILDLTLTIIYFIFFIPLFKKKQF